MRRRLTMSAAAAGLAFAALAVAPTAAGALDDAVDIRVEHDLPAPDQGSVGPRVLEVTGVSAGPGAEVTVADETENPSFWGGNVLVDIDPDAQTITVEVEDQDCYGSTLVEITTDEIVSVTTDSDAIYIPGQDIALTTGVSGGVVTLSWLHGSTDPCPGYGDEGSQSVFSYQVAAELTVTPSAGAPGDTVTASGTACEGDEVDVTVSLDGSEVTTTTATVDGDDNWTSDIDTTGFADGTYDVDAECSIFDDPIFDYETQSFTLTTPTSTSEGTTTTTSTVPAETTEATAAAPTVAAPTFTG